MVEDIKNPCVGLNPDTWFFVVEATGFEPAASWSQTKRSTKLSHASFSYDGSLYISAVTMSTRVGNRGTPQKRGAPIFPFAVIPQSAKCTGHSKARAGRGVPDGFRLPRSGLRRCT